MLIETMKTLPKPPRFLRLDHILTAAEEKLVRSGEAQLKRGESKPWRTVKRTLSRYEILSPGLSYKHVHFDGDDSN